MCMITSFSYYIQQHCQDEWRPTEVIRAALIIIWTNAIHLFACPVFMFDCLTVTALQESETVV